MDKNFRITSKFLLAVEGKDECNFFTAILNFLSINNVQIVDLGGKDKFPNELPLLMTLDGFRKLTAIGLVRDAEDNIAPNAFESICVTLIKNGLTAPASLNESAVGPPRIGIFIMPDNQGAGMLENLCLKTLEGQRIEKCIDDYITCITEAQLVREKGQFNCAKARVQTYLSSQAPLVNSLGLGALKGYWDFNNACFEKIKQFLHNLFIEI